MHREYLKENHPVLFNDLVLSCQLWTYLADINGQAQDRLKIIISQMQKAESVTEEMKENNQWEWIQRMNSIFNRAEEIVLSELINLYQKSCLEIWKKQSSCRSYSAIVRNFDLFCFLDVHDIISMDLMMTVKTLI